jgi:glycosyltransferase involved in cell wall biosynthesis
MSLVSVILCSYNQSETIEETIESVLEQTYRNFELIIVDSMSNKNDCKYLIKYLDNEKIKSYTIPSRGLSNRRNFGVSQSNGEYVLFIDADDKIDKTFLEKTVRVLIDNPNIGFCYTDTQHFGDSNGFWEQPEYDFNRLLQGNYICSCSLIRKKAFLESGGFDKNNYGYWEDYEFWIKLGSIGWFGKHIPEKLFYYRIHKQSGMQSDRNSKLAHVYNSYIIGKFPALYNIEITNHVKEILSKYPKDFMTWDFDEQEKYLKDKGKDIR